MLAEISAGLTSLKAALDITKGLNAANTQANVNEVRIELQQLILDAQQSLAAASEAQVSSTQLIAELKDEISRLKDWSAEKQRYQIAALERGAVAFIPRRGVENGELPHWLCAHCFNEGRKSYLQFNGNHSQAVGGAISKYICDACNGSVVVSWGTEPSYENDRG